MPKELSSLTAEEQKVHREKFGRYNDYPPNWKECSPDEFWGKFMVYAQRLEEYRQMYTKGTNKYVSARLYFFDQGEGLAMVDDYDWEKFKHKTPKLFKFALCEHEWEHTGTPYNCYNTYKCKKCGNTMGFDSSD